MVAFFITLLAFFPDSTSTIVIQSSQRLFLSAVSLAINSSGSLFVADQQSNSLVEITYDQKTSKKIGGQGWGNTEFDFPCDVTSSFLLDIYVVDKYNRRIQQYDKDLNFIQTVNEYTIANIVGHFQPLSCAVSSQGDLFVIESDEKRIIKINRRGSILKEFGKYSDGVGALEDPKDITTVSIDIIAVLDRNTIKLYDAFGNYIRTIVLSKDQNWKTIQSYNETIIATSGNSISQYSIEGDLINSVSSTMIIGFDLAEELQDVVFAPTTVYLLTSTTVYSAIIVESR